MLRFATDQERRTRAARSVDAIHRSPTMTCASSAVISCRPRATLFRRRRSLIALSPSPVKRTEKVWFDPPGAPARRHFRAADRAAARSRRIGPAGPSHRRCLQVLVAAIEGDEKRRGLAVDERAAEHPFVDPPLLGRVRRCKRIARVQRCIAECEVKEP